MIDSIAKMVGLYPAGTQSHQMLASALVYAYQGNWMHCRIALVNARNMIGAPHTQTAAQQINPIIEGIDRLQAVGRVA